MFQCRMCQFFRMGLIKVLIAMIPDHYFPISDYIKLVKVVKLHFKTQVTYYN